jgi:hypothetical protein
MLKLLLPNTARQNQNDSESYKGFKNADHNWNWKAFGLSELDTYVKVGFLEKKSN